MLVPKTRGLTEFTKYIDGIARNSRGVVTEVMTDYFLGNEQRGLRHYPPQMGQQYVRTFTARRGWIRRGQGVTSRAENTVYYSAYLWKEGSQAWWAARYNWRTAIAISETNIKGAIQAAERAMVRKK